MAEETAGEQRAPTREERWQRRLAVPVLIAALVSVPAVFLTLFSGAWEATGSVLNTLSGIVLVGETVILLLVTEDKKGWIRRNLWLIALTVVVLVGTLLALGPVQLLRLLRMVGTLRVLRAGRIFKAGRLLAGRAEGRLNRIAALVVSVLVAVFVAVTLSDPTSSTRSLIRTVIPLDFGPVTVTIAGLLLAAATFLVLFDRGGPADHEPAESPRG